MAKPTTIRLPDSLDKLIEKEAQAQGMKKSPLIIKMIGEWFALKKKNTNILKDHMDWREIVHSSEYQEAMTEIFSLMREDQKELVRSVLREMMHVLIGAQRDVVIGVFRSPEYQGAVKDVVQEILLSPEFMRLNREATASFIASPEFTEMISQVVKKTANTG